MRVYVLLFNARTENEGIHTLQLGARNIVLMFESEDDATRYALLLEAQDFLSPAVEVLDSEEIEEFCISAGYEAKLVPEGFLPGTSEDRLMLVPPEINLENTDWNPEGKTAQVEAEEDDTESGEDDALEQMRRRLEGLL
jgi:hypothetical protein